MGKIFYLMGKSCAGKDSLYNILKNDEELGLLPVIRYTTRPIRDGETDGETYHFVDEKGYSSYKDAGKIIEEQVYHTMHGDWRYFTADDGGIEIGSHNYLAIGVLDSFAGTRDYFGKDTVLPIYIQLDDGERLQRALARERLPENGRYAEMCRRFLSDAEDFSAERIEKLGIPEDAIFENNDLEDCAKRIKSWILRLIR
ncbi:MAG: guanylate kinase [Lachnospiraceae bacterium]|nr:guanylate kinase [Lachnospiraceae bacterium]